MGVGRHAAIGAFTIAVATIARAQDSLPPFEVPFADRAPAVDRERGWLHAAAVGLADERLRLLSARRDAARASARARALAALHRFADDALARARAAPACASEVHRVIDSSARIEAARPLADGSTVLVVAVPLDRLARACPGSGLPWAG